MGERRSPGFCAKFFSNYFLSGREPEDNKIGGRSLFCDAHLLANVVDNPGCRTSSIYLSLADLKLSTMPTISQVSDTVQKAILQAIVEEDQSLVSGDPITFKEICNRQTHLFGPKNSDKRNRIKSRRQNFLRTARNYPDKFVELLRKFDIHPAEMVKKVHLKSDATDQTPTKSSGTKMSTRSPAQPSSNKKEDYTPSKTDRDFTDYEEEDFDNESGFTSFFHLDGTEDEAEDVRNMRVGEGMEHLNAPFDLVQDLEKVQFDTDSAKIFARCVAFHYTSEFGDVAGRHVSIKKTIWPNVLLLEEPWVKASLRADLTTKDRESAEANTIKEYKFGAAARNMKTRDENGEMTYWWCLDSWDQHSCSIDAMAEMQESEGKADAIRMKKTLLVFSKSQFDFHDAFWDKTLQDNCDENGLFTANCEPYNKDGQGITRLRWIVPTSQFRVARKKIQAKPNTVADDITRMTAGMKISEKADMESQGGVDI